MFFDTHAHLNDERFDADREEVLRACLSADVGRVVEIADSPSQWDRAVALSRARPAQVRCSLGLHPYHAADWDESIAEALPRKAALPEVVAVGEIGLDYAKSPAPPEAQKSALARMLALAKACRKPVVLHCRQAYADLMPILEREFAAPPETGRFHGVLHCFSGGKKDALRAARLGFALGVDGPVTYPKNGALREALAAAGLDRLVLETDSPYLPPQSSRGKRNDPRALPEIAGALGALFGAPVEEVARRTTANALDLFRMA